MKKGWTVTIEGRAARALDPDALGEELAEHHAVVDYKDGLVSTTATVDASSFMEAIDFVYEALVGAIHGRLDVEHAEAMIEQRQIEELEISNAPDLVGIAEIAELANTTRQRVFQMTANKGFPAALLELRSGRLWSRPAIEGYLEGREATRRPIKTLTSQVGGATVSAALRSKQRALAKRR